MRHVAGQDWDESSGIQDVEGHTSDSLWPRPSGFTKFDTATLHEAYEGNGALPSTIKPVSPESRLEGPAFPVLCPPGDNLWIHRGLYAAPEGSVLVVSVGGHREAGYWGEVLTVAAIERRLAGLVIDGGVRDADRIVATGFPVFCTTLCIRGTKKDPEGQGSAGAPISISDTVVRSGDVVVGDRDGVVVISRSDVEDVRLAAERRSRSETEILDRLRRGESTLDIYGLPRG